MTSSNVHADKIMVSARNNKLSQRFVKHIKVNDSRELQYIYTFGKKLGQGSFGTVIAAVEKHTDTPWAVKIISKAHVGNRIKFVRQEIQILKMVDHPYIIYMEKVFESQRKLYLVFELCREELADKFRQKSIFHEKEVLTVLQNLASAVAYLHRNDIVHRDLKMENILLMNNPSHPDDQWNIKLTDFSLSVTKNGPGFQNMLEDYCGTLVYMAPEMLIRKPYSEVCDVWSMGVIMYILLGGRYPFYASNDRELYKKIVYEQPSFTGFKAGPEAINLLTKMLAKNPAFRITAAEVLEHPWIRGVRMAHDSPENVLDMMSLWKSEMLIPSAADTEWIHFKKPQVKQTYSPVLSMMSQMDLDHSESFKNKEEDRRKQVNIPKVVKGNSRPGTWSKKSKASIAAASRSSAKTDARGPAGSNVSRSIDTPTKHAMIKQRTSKQSTDSDSSAGPSHVSNNAARSTQIRKESKKDR